MSVRRVGVAAAAVAVLAMVLTGHVFDTSLPVPQAGQSATATGLLGPTAELLDQLEELPAAPVEPGAPYERDAFGQRWADVDHSGCDQRNEALALAMTSIEYRPGTNRCVIERGIFTDPYTGTSWEFVKSDAGGGVDIDHVVPLAHAWQMGAASWTAQQREQFANELQNLQATQAEANRSKGEQTPQQWLPPNERYTCTYVERWTQIKVTWQLEVSAAERTWLTVFLHNCPSSTEERTP